MSMTPFPDSGQPANPRKLAQTERVRLLAGIPMFGGLAKRHLRAIARKTRVALVEPGTEFITDGEPATEVFVIVAGHAFVRRAGRKIATLGPGDFVGELGVLLNRPRASSVHAESAVELLVLDRAGLKTVLLDVPQIAWPLLTTIADRLSDPH